MSGIEALTFDLWDTVIIDDSDEPIRARFGLRSKRDERRFVLWNSLNEVTPISYDFVCAAYNKAETEFNRVWHDEFITWTAEERIGKVLDAIGINPPGAVVQGIIDEFESMELTVPPEPVDGVRKALEILSSEYPLAVVSDAIVTPGRNLRLWLENFDLLQFFTGFAFSDEVGRSKPHPDIFNSAAAQLGTQPNRMLHIGDREHNDIRGAHAMGMRAFLFVGTRDTDLVGTTADAVFENYADLPEILRQVSESGD